MPELQIKIVSADGACPAIPSEVLDDMIGLCLPVVAEGDHYVVRSHELTDALETSGRTVALAYHAPVSRLSEKLIEKHRCVVLG